MPNDPSQLDTDDDNTVIGDPVAQQFVATDGQTFDNEIDAKNHQSLVDAKFKFDDAKAKYALLLAQTFETADGKPFRFELYNNYWHIRTDVDPPQLINGRFSPLKTQLDGDKVYVVPMDQIGNPVYRLEVAEIFIDADEAKARFIEVLTAYRTKIDAHIQRLKD